MLPETAFVEPLGPALGCERLVRLDYKVDAVEVWVLERVVGAAVWAARFAALEGCPRDQPRERIGVVLQRLQG
jgi:hypothetical protein